MPNILLTTVDVYEVITKKIEKEQEDEPEEFHELFLFNELVIICFSC